MNVTVSVVEQANSLRQQYARLSTDIGHLKDDPVYRADSAWGKEVLAVAVMDADLMVRVAEERGRKTFCRLRDVPGCESAPEP